MTRPVDAVCDYESVYIDGRLCVYVVCNLSPNACVGKKCWRRRERYGQQDDPE